MHSWVPQIPRTTRVKGKMARQWAIILIDSSNAHNFVDTVEVRRSKFPVCAKEKVKVQVANGDHLISEGKGQNIIVNSQRYSFSMTFCD